MQVIICDVCRRGIDPQAERVYGQLTVQTSMGLGAQAIDAHLSCYRRLTDALAAEAKAELPHIWREGDPDDVTTPVDAGTAVPPPTDPTAETPLPPPGSEQLSPAPTGPDVGTGGSVPDAPEQPAAAAEGTETDPPADPTTPEVTGG